MSKLYDDSYLLDILDSAEQIIFFTINITIDEFEKDLKCNFAVQRLFEIIGEATKNLSTELRENNPQVDWKSMAGIRWLHHKKFLAEYRLKRKITWEEAAAEYKGILDDIGKNEKTDDIMKKLKELHQKLKELRKKK